MRPLGLVWFGKNVKTREFCFSLQACVIFHHLFMYSTWVTLNIGLVWFGKDEKNPRILPFVAGMCDISPPVDVHG
jgi:hypothetical protein